MKQATHLKQAMNRLIFSCIIIVISLTPLIYFSILTGIFYPTFTQRWVNGDYGTLIWYDGEIVSSRWNFSDTGFTADQLPRIKTKDSIWAEKYVQALKDGAEPPPEKEPIITKQDSSYFNFE